MEHHSGVSILGRLLTLLENRLGWEPMSSTNTPAYYENSQIVAVKSFITLAQGLIFVNKSEVHFTLRTALKYYTRVKATERDKRTSLLRYKIGYENRCFFVVKCCSE